MKTITAIVCLLLATLFSYGQEVTQIEYFINTDAGVGQNTKVNITPSADNEFNFSADLTGVLPGYHKLYIRTKDTNGKWSITARKQIEVVAQEAKTEVSVGEYFFDTDPGYGNASPITIDNKDSVILQNFNAAVTGLLPGYHKLYGRVKDSYGKWGHTFRHNVTVVAGEETTLVTTVEYFFDTDPRFGSGDQISFVSPAADGIFDFVIPASKIPSDSTTLFVRVKESINGNWSMTKIANTTVLLPLTLLDLTATKENGSVRLNWQTTNEINTSHFNIQRSTNGNSFTAVGRTDAKGNSTAINSYSYMDNVAGVKNGKLYYRLQMVDKDGKTTYSKVIVITINDGGLKITIRPNPAKDYFIVSSSSERASIVVKDVSGKVVLRQNISAAGDQRVNIAALAKGIYMVSIVDETGIKTTKLVVE
ncbi:MAG: T9SS type A sorting domain-containing protein [Panacibacter sp.]